MFVSYIVLVMLISFLNHDAKHGQYCLAQPHAIPTNHKIKINKNDQVVFII